MRHLIFSLALTFTFLIVGCDGGGSSRSSSPAVQQSGITAELAGSALKGIIKNGVVEVFDPADQTTVLARGSTNEGGSYSLTLPATANFNGEFLLIVVSGANDGSAAMICDVPSGCDGVAFGAEVEIGSDFTLRALVPTPTAGSTREIQINPFTDLASELALNSTSLNLTAVENANSQVRALFELGSTDLTRIPPIDLTDPVAVENTDETSLRAAALGAAILAASQEQSWGTLASRLDDFRNTLAANGGQLVGYEFEDSASIFSLEDVLDHGISVLQKAGPGSETATRLAQELATRLTDVRAGTADALTDIRPSPGAGQTAAQQARQLVGDLQLLLAALSQQSVENHRLAFRNGLEAGKDILSGDLELVLGGLQEVAAAIALTAKQFQADDTLTRSLVSGIEVSISQVGEQVVFSVSAHPFNNGVTVNLVATLSIQADDLDYETPTWGEEATAEADDLVFLVNGSASNQGVSLVIDSGKIAVSDFFLHEIRDDEFEFTGITRIGTFNFALRSSVVQRGVDEPLSFKGLMTIAADAVSIDETGKLPPFNGVPGSAFHGFSRTFMFDLASIVLSGDVHSSGESVGMTISGRINGNEAFLGDLPVGHTRVLYAYEVSPDKRQLTITDVDIVDSVVTYELLTYNEYLSLSDTGNAFTSNVSSGSPVLHYLRTVEGHPQLEYYMSAPVFSQAAPLQISLDITEFLSGIFSAGLIAVRDEGIYRTDAPHFIDASGTVEGSIICAGYCRSSTAPYLDANTQQQFTADNFVTGALSVAVRASILGIDSEDPTVEFKLTASQTGFNQGELSLAIKFAGRKLTTTTSLLRLDQMTENPSLVVRNQDDVVMTLTRDEASGTVSGTITKNGEQLATISEAFNALIVRFNDGQNPNVQTLAF
jgi:hypothetical protein